MHRKILGKQLKAIQIQRARRLNGQCCKIRKKCMCRVKVLKKRLYCLIYKTIPKACNDVLKKEIIF